MEHTPQSSEHWRTLVSLLHVGDEITLHWDKGGLVTEFLKERSITGDTLDIVITRNGKKLTFRIDCYVGDSRHRMVTTQRAEYAIA
jgi:sortase (surface protein transpeptidase)